MLGLALFAALIVANAYFVAAEFGMIAIDPASVAQRAEEGDRSARRLQKLLRKLTFHLSGAQLGITVMSLLLGSVAEPTVARLIEPTIERVVGESGAAAVSVTIALFIATVAHMVLGEQVPKYVALARPSIALTLSPIITAWGKVARPVIWLSNTAANRVVRLLGQEPRDDLDTTHSLEELKLLVQASGDGGTLDPEEVELLTRSIRFTQKQATESLVSRVDVRAVHRDQMVTDVVEASIETGFSRFPVYGEDLDDVVGVVHVKSVYSLPREARAITPVTAIMGRVLAVPETSELERLFFDLRTNQIHMAVVVDEHGGTAGIITLEDLLEEIVGEISDEHDGDGPEEGWVEKEGTYTLAGLLHTDEVLDATGFAMPDGDYTTVAGFVLDRLGHIPVVGEVVEHDGWRLEVAGMDRLRIETVRMEPVPAPDGDRDGPP